MRSWVFGAIGAAVLVGGGFWWTQAAPPADVAPRQSADRIVIQRGSGAVLTYGDDVAAGPQLGEGVDLAKVDAVIGSFWPCRVGSAAEAVAERRRGLDLNQPFDSGVIRLPVCAGGQALSR